MDTLVSGFVFRKIGPLVIIILLGPEHLSKAQAPIRGEACIQLLTQFRYILR